MQYKFYNNSEAVLAAPLISEESLLMELAGAEGKFYKDVMHMGQCVQVTLEDSERVEVLDIVDWDDTGAAVLSAPPDGSWPIGTPVQVRITEDQLRNFPQYDQQLEALVVNPRNPGGAANTYGAPDLRLAGNDTADREMGIRDDTMVSREIVIATHQLLFADSGGDFIYDPGVSSLQHGQVLRSAAGTRQLSVVESPGRAPWFVNEPIDFDTDYPQYINRNGSGGAPQTFTDVLFPAPFPLVNYQFHLVPGGRAFIPSEMGVISLTYALAAPLEITVTATGMDYLQFDLARDEALTGLGTSGSSGLLHRKDLRNHPPLRGVTISVEGSPAGFFVGVLYLKGFIIDLSSSPY